MMLRSFAVLALGFASPAVAQSMLPTLPAGQISGIGNPETLLNLGFRSTFLIDYGDDVEARRAARMRQIIAAHPEFLERWKALSTRSERVAYVRSLDRKTPR